MNFFLNKYVISAIISALLLGGVYWWWTDHNGKEQEIGEKKCLQRYSDEEVAALRLRVKELEVARNGLSNEMELLQKQRINLPTISVRLCKYKAQDTQPSLPAAGQDRPAGAGTLPEEGPSTVTAGPDIGKGLDELWDEADEVVARCRAAGH